jgi:hypothetical protein
VKSDSDYTMTIPSFEMGGITDGVVKHGGSVVRSFSDNMGIGGKAAAKNSDDESSSEDESDSDVEEAEMGGFKDEGDFI